MSGLLPALLAAGTVLATSPAFAAPPSKAIRLLVRADDMGASHGVDAGIIDSVKNGIARSVEVIVPAPWAPEAIKFFLESPDVDVGIHLALTSEWENIRWRPLTAAPSLRDADGYFFSFVRPNQALPPGNSIREAVDGGKVSLDEVKAEVGAQITALKTKLPALSHASAHMDFSDVTPEIHVAVDKLIADAGLVSEYAGTQPLPFPTPFPGHRGTGPEKEAALVAALEAVGPGTWLFVCHPGSDDPEMRAVWHRGYREVAADRAAVTFALTSAKVKEVIARRHIALISYRDVVRETARRPAAKKPR